MNRRNLIKNIGGATALLGCATLSAGSWAEPVLRSSFPLEAHEKQHLLRFSREMNAEKAPLNTGQLKALHPVRLIDRKVTRKGYRLEYISREGNRVVLEDMGKEQTSFYTL